MKNKVDLFGIVLLAIFLSVGCNSPVKKKSEDHFTKDSFSFDPMLGFKIGMPYKDAVKIQAEIIREKGLKYDSWVEFMYNDKIPASFFLSEYPKDTLGILRIHIKSKVDNCGTTAENINQVFSLVIGKYGAPDTMIVSTELMYEKRNGGFSESPIKTISGTYFEWYEGDLVVRLMIIPSYLCLDSQDGILSSELSFRKKYKNGR